jgi:uncharacterized protein with HEPN domain
MQRDRDIACLLDVQHEAKMALGFVAGKTFAEFEDDSQCHYAVIRAIEIIGEAAGRVSDDYVAQHPEIPWRQVIGMRNRMIHGYDDIVLSVVWEVLQTHIPDLLRLVEPLVPSESG